MKILKNAIALMRDALALWTKDDIPRLGAALAYYSLFSLGPLLLIIISTVGFFFGEEAARGKVFTEMQGIVGAKGAEAIQTIVESANKPTTGLVASAIGLVTFLMAATGAFVELKHALNVVWGATDKSASGLKGFLRDRVLSFAMLLVIGFLLMVSLVASAAIGAAGKWMFLGVKTEVLLTIGNFALSAVILTSLMAAMFRFLPDTKVAWRDTWFGAAVTTLLFLIGRSLLSMTLIKSSNMEVYGAAGSLVLVLVWGYYCAQIFLFGAAITTAFAQRFGSRRDAAGAAGERKLEKEVEKKPEPKAKNDAFPIALPNPRIL